MQLIPTALKIDSVKKFKEDDYFSFLDFDGDNKEINSIYESFSSYREDNSNDYSIILLVLICIQFSTLFCCCLCIKESLDLICENENGNKNIFMLLNIVFGLVSGFIYILSPFLYYPCENKYSDYFKLDEYLYAFARDDGFHFNEINRTVVVEEYFYEDYPVLEKIRNYYYKNNKNEKIELNFTNLGYIYITIIFTSIIATIISFILLNILIYRKNIKKHL